jgi:hypothetical protein
VAKLAAMPSQAIIDGMKGFVDFYEYMGIPVARKWPRSPGHNRSPAVQAQWPLFKAVAQGWGELPATVKQAYKAMSLGTDYTARDMFTTSVISGLEYASMS